MVDHDADVIARPVERRMKYSLADLRRHSGRTQQQMADALWTTQSGVSRLERQKDLLLSTFVAYAKAAGGNVRVLVEFPEGTFELDVAKLWDQP